MNPRNSILKGLAKTAAVLAVVMATGAAASAQQVYRFGLAMPLTGSQALYGQDQVKAAQWAVDEINKAGGINGKKLEMIVLDTQADPQVGIQAVNRLISVEKVPAFITAWSGVVKAVAPIANDNKVVELSVGDTGIGLPAEMMGRLFKPFSSTKNQGMGIGLSVCREIVESHEGKIWVEPNPDGGTIFRFTLPLVGEEMALEAV